MPIILKADDIASFIDMDKAIELTEAVVKEMHAGQTAVHPPYHLNVPGGALRVVSAALKDSQVMGLRFGPALQLTPPSGYRNHVATLYGTDGELLAIMGYPFSTMRTGATVAVGVKHLAKPEASTVGLIGTGSNAISLLEGVRHVRKITDVAVFSRDAERRAKFAKEAARLTGLDVRPVEAIESAVADRDIVLTSTNFRQPLFPFEWLAPGTHVSSMGPIGEIDRGVFLNAQKIVVSCKEQEKTYLYPVNPWPLVELVAEHELSWDDIDELGSVVVGAATTRRPFKNGITVFHESAGGFGDVKFAHYAYEMARKLGFGQEVTF
jgi:alanine dehydrogenase